MINLFITAAKYIQLLLIVLYTYCNFRYQIGRASCRERVCKQV